MSSSTAFHAPCSAGESSRRIVAGLDANLPPPPGIAREVAFTRVNFGGGYTSPTLWNWLLDVLKGGRNG